MEFSHARLFVALSEHKSILGASKAIGLGQSSVSQRLRQFEREVGGEVFVRVPGSLVLTPLGQVLLPSAKALVDSFSNAYARVRSESGAQAGRVDISTVGNSIDRLIPALAHVRAHHPSLRMRVVQVASEHSLLDHVREGLSDIGFGYLRPDVVESAALDEVRVSLVGHDECCIVLPKELDHLEQPLPLHALPDIPVIAAPDDAVSRLAVEVTLARAGIRRRVGATTEHRSMLVPLVERGVGMAWSTVASASAAKTDMAVRTFSEPILLPLFTVWRQTAAAGSAALMQRVIARIMACPVPSRRVVG